MTDRRWIVHLINFDTIPHEFDTYEDAKSWARAVTFECVIYSPDGIKVATCSALHGYHEEAVLF